MPIHDGRKLNDPKRKRFNPYLFFLNNKKIITKYLIICIVLLILLFPQESGQIIGNWLRDFFITMLSVIING